MIGSRGRCSCGAPVWWVHDIRGRLVALDPLPVRGGDMTIDHRIDGHTVTRPTESHPNIVRYVRHASTCRQGELFK